MSRPSAIALVAAAAFAGGLLVGRGVPAASAAAPAAPNAPAAPRVFELRTYTTPPGRLPDLQRRFREHTMEIFVRHGMTNVAYFTPQDSARKDNTIVYLLAFPSREVARASWAAFGADPEWKRVAAESEKNGRIVEKVESVFLDPIDFSPIQ